MHCKWAKFAHGAQIYWSLYASETYFEREIIDSTSSGRHEGSPVCHSDRDIWFLLTAQCDNGAVAATTPVYAIVDGRKHWCAERGPAIIQQQFAAIEGIQQEFAEDYSPRGRGILWRLAKAQKYYRELLQAMESAP